MRVAGVVCVVNNNNFFFFLASYDVNKDGVKVAVLTFPKTVYRLGETVLGVVEVNERESRARVVKVSAMLETHERLPAQRRRSRGRRRRLVRGRGEEASVVRRAHAEAHCAFTMDVRRVTFKLAVPADASPAFCVRVGEGDGEEEEEAGGLVWKVRLCLLVGVGVGRMRTLGRDGERGEWGSSWIANGSAAPLERVERGGVGGGDDGSWTRFFGLGFGWGGEGIGKEEVEEGGYYDGIVPDLEGGVGVGVDYLGGSGEWREVRMETVECEVPIRVVPGNTAFKALDVVFDV